MQGWGIVFAAIAYLLLLFVVASYGDRRRRPAGTQRSHPAIYSLSLAIYCTSWTFFGSVGLAATSGLDFLGIYLGPILVVTIAFPIFSHVISVAKSQRITSIADFIAARYGKSTAAGALAAIIAVVGTVPYIALQLKAVANSVDSMIGQYQPLSLVDSSPVDTAFFVSVILALFAVLFGTRHADATEHQRGMMLAVATESIVKLLAFLAVGIFVTYFLFDGVGDIWQQANASAYVGQTFNLGVNPSTFVIFTLLSFCAFLLLPRQFHVGVVENHSDREARTARWLFPLYLVLINIFVVPVALAGMLQFGQSIGSDNFVLALPLANDAQAISLFVFIGGLSAATAMVIVACVALAIMLSNNIVLPLLLQRDSRTAANEGDMAPLLLNIRRAAIFCILAMAYAYFKAAGDSAALASIGLLSFVAVAQFAPAFFGGMLWRRANTRGALWGMSAGFLAWFYTLFLPTLLDPTAALLTSGPLGIDWMRPQSILGIELAPLTHGVVFSLGVNCLALVVGSLSRENRAIERMQANAFWFYGGRIESRMAQAGHSVSVGELQAKVANYLGQERCARAFAKHGETVGRVAHPDETADGDLMHLAEQLLASAIGAASSRLVISLMVQKRDVATESTLQLLDDASEALQQNRDMLQTAIDQVEQGISVFDADFCLSSWNRRFRDLLQLPADIGQAGTPLSKVADAIEERCEWQSDGKADFVTCLLETTQPWQITLKGSKRIIEISTKVLPVGGHVISWHDTTESVNAAAALQVANETLERRVEERTLELTQLNEDLARAREAADAANIGKTKFLAAVGHDILQPLNAARLYASSLSEQLADTTTKQLASNVDDSLDAVEDILGAVLAISRLDSGALKPNKSDFSADTLLERLDVEFRPIAAAKGLIFNVERSGFAVHSDFNLLQRLLQNLVSNAIKYTTEGSVTLETSIHRDKLFFYVKDTGAGIPQSEQAIAFEEFKRLDSGKNVANGLGLGLSIVKRLGETLDHKIQMKSVVGKGTDFTVEVPLGKGVVGLETANDPEPSKQEDLSGLRVVCLDNEPRILDGMKSLLGGWGCDVSCFEHPKAMQSALEECSPSVLIADYHLHSGTGLEAIGKVRAQLGDDIVAILITADRSAAVRKAANAADVILLNKPLKPAALRAILSRQMFGQRAQSVVDAAQ